MSNPSLSVSTAWTDALSASMVGLAKAKLEEVLMRFTEVVATDCKVERSILCSIWSRVAPDCAMDLKAAIEKETKKKEAEVKKLQKKEEEKNGPGCEYVYGPKAKKANQPCGEFCKDDTVAEDGKVYCNKHKKQVGSKHTCCFVFGPKASNHGEECGARITKDVEPFNREGEYEDHDYEGKWICKKHTEQVNKALDRKDNQCTHEYGEKSKNAGERCTSLAKEGGKCAKHQGGKKEKSDTTAEKDKRKAAKKGNDKKSDEDDEDDVKPLPDKKKVAVIEAKSTKAEKPSKKAVNDNRIMVKLNFKKKGGTPKFVHTLCKNDGGTDFSAFVDITSGLVCINPDDSDAKSAEPDTIQSLGVWDNDLQTFVELTPEAIVYSESVSIPVFVPDESSDEEDPEEQDSDDSND